MDRLFFSRKNAFLFAAMTAAVLGLIYGLSLTNGFVVWDDALLVTANPTAHGLTWMNIKTAFTTYDPELYIPLTLLSFQVNYALHGLEPFGYHLGNLLLHFACTLLVAWSMFGIAKNKIAAIVAALLFAVHPINVEAVAWVSGRKDVLAAVFFLLSLGAFTKKEESERFWLWYGISVASFFLGLLAKVSIVTLPLILILVDWYTGKFPWMSGGARTSADMKKYFFLLIPFFGLSLLFAVIASLGKASSDVFFFEKFLMGCLSIALHLWHVVVPVGFSVLYPYTQPLSLLTPNIFGSVVLLIAMVVGTWMLRKKTRAPFFAVAWFLLLLGPSMTNIAKGHNELLDVYVTSDRYAYLPVISVFLLFGLGMSYMMRMNVSFRRVCIGVLVAILSLFSIISFFLAGTWKNTVTLFTQTITHHKNAYVAYTNLGTELYKAGQVDEALVFFEKSLKVRTDSTTLFNMGVIERERGNAQKALEYFLAAAESSLVDASPRIAVATMLIEDGQWDNAETFLRQAVEDAHPSTHLYQLLGAVLEQQRKPAEAKEAYRKSLQVDAQNQTAKERLEALGG